MARWSQVSVMVIIGRRRLAVADDDAFLGRAHGEDRGLRRIEDGDELLDAVHAEVRDRERAALEVLAAELAVAGAPTTSARARGDLGDGVPLGSRG